MDQLHPEVLLVEGHGDFRVLQAERVEPQPLRQPLASDCIYHSGRQPRKSHSENHMESLCLIDGPVGPARTVLGTDLFAALLTPP